MKDLANQTRECPGHENLRVGWHLASASAFRALSCSFRCVLFLTLTISGNAIPDLLYAWGITCRERHGGDKSPTSSEGERCTFCEKKETI